MLLLLASVTKTAYAPKLLDKCPTLLGNQSTAFTKNYFPAFSETAIPS